ncbi:glycosyltransferase [Clostridium sp.]|uniref:glycosyltransferase n=1 Tax=Clostridium sp. TaxID=1506 RepID=UPI003D6D0596
MQKVKMILTNRFDPDVRVYKEAQYLVLKGFDVEILCWDRESEYKSREIEEIDGINIKRFFPYAKAGTGYKQIIPYIKFLKECKNYLRGKEYDYLHCHDLDGVIVGNHIKNSNSKLVFDMHEFYEVQGSKQKIRYIVRAIVNNMQIKSDAIIYVNQMQKDVMKKKNINKLIYIPNYPIASDFENCEKSKSEKLRISYIGAVRQYNELKNLMDACNDIDNIKVSIHGTGVAYKKLNDIKNNYKNIEVTGVYHFSESSKLYSQTDVLYAIYPMNTFQNRNAYPVKFFEAIITKTPIIVSKGSILEKFIMENDIGFVVDGSNVSEITELISYINSHRKLLQEKTENIEKIQFDFSWGEVVKNMDSIYERDTI